MIPASLCQTGPLCQTTTAAAFTWASATASHTFQFKNNGPYYAYARDVAGNLSAPVLFTIDRIDKHSPVIDAISWEKAWTQEKTVTVTATVTAHDAESGLGQYAMTKTEDEAYTLLWEAMNAAFETQAASGADRTHCVFAEGAITIYTA